MGRCLECNVECQSEFCSEACAREYDTPQPIDWDRLEREARAEIAAEDAARRVS